MSLVELALGGNHPTDAPAVITPEGTWTRARLAAEIEVEAATLTRVTRPGDRVAILCANRPEVVALLLAIPAAGRVAVPVNTRLTPAEVAAQLDAVGATALVAGPAELDQVGPVVPGVASIGTALLVEDRTGALSPIDTIRGPRGTSTRSGHAAPAAAGAAGGLPRGVEDPAWIIFTSGTTGRPKGVVLSAGGLAAGVATSVAARPLAPDDVYLYPFPLFHVSAYNVLHALHRGRPVVLPPRFDPETIGELAEHHRVTTMSLAPTMLRMLLDAGTALRTLRTISYGAAPMAPALLAEASECLGVGFAQGYGMTELSGNAVFLSPRDHERGLDGEQRLLGAAGWPGPGVELRITDDDGSPLPAGEAGELRVRASQVTPGYWDDPRTTEETIVDGWLRTGDIGVLDHDGLLTIVDRAKDIIVTGGENVASREVEEVLGSHPSVSRVAVVGMPDEHWGEAVWAAVVLAPGASPDHRRVGEDLRALAARSLAGFKVPKRIVIVDDLPVNAGGKVVKADVRRLLDPS